MEDVHQRIPSVWLHSRFTFHEPLLINTILISRKSTLTSEPHPKINPLVKKFRNLQFIQKFQRFVHDNKRKGLSFHYWAKRCLIFRKFVCPTLNKSDHTDPTHWLCQHPLCPLGGVFLSQQSSSDERVVLLCTWMHLPVSQISRSTSLISEITPV